MLSGYHQLPSLRHYWSTEAELHCDIVADAMARNQFIEILQYLHYADNSNLDQKDRLAKVHPLMDLPNKKFAMAIGTNIDVDEAMIEYFGGHGCKQTICNKPVRFEYKAWCLNAPDGYLIQFDVCQGATEGSHLDHNYGKGGNTLIQQLTKLPQQIRGLPLHIFDNYFTTLSLLVELSKCNYNCTGTIHSNRIPKSCPTTASNTMKKMTYASISTVLDRKHQLGLTQYKYNAVVTIASTTAHAEPMQKVGHWSATEKNRLSVNQAQAAYMYNHFIGGTERCNHCISLYRSGIRKKKWWWPLFTWMIDAGSVNAQLLHRKD